jgi:hypothetical protein
MKKGVKMKTNIGVRVIRARDGTRRLGHQVRLTMPAPMAVAGSRSPNSMMLRPTLRRARRGLVGVMGIMLLGVLALIVVVAAQHNVELAQFISRIHTVASDVTHPHEALTNWANQFSSKFQGLQGQYGMN